MAARLPDRSAPSFDETFRNAFADLLAWRRDVRHFKPDPIAEALIDDILDLACLAPSVGNSQPWRFVSVDAADRRQRILKNFRACNEAALDGYDGEQARLYAALKLAGLEEAPVHLAVFCDEDTDQGHGLGTRTMPETLRYSAVMAVHGLWLAARAHGLGVGWVSILDPARAADDLAVPDGWSLVAYLCIGWPLDTHLVPELERAGWQAREATCRQVLQR
jgi:5,6-dimethylbenzimidazole synthase